MQFENKTYEALLADMLSGIASDVLKIEGSVIYDAVSPMAMKLAEVYENLNFIINQLSVETASAPYLDRLTEQMGITRHIATYAERRAEFYNNVDELMDVPLGSRFSIDAVNYVVEEQESTGIYRLMAETPGAIGNMPIGTMQALTYVDGLAKSLLTDIITVGDDAETDDVLRIRYLTLLSTDAQDGNIAQYQKWAEDYTGIGRIKVIPLWNGSGTVKVSILSSDNTAAGASLIDAFQEYLDPGSVGLGNGVAPIGAKVTVSTAANKTVNIAAQIVLDSGYNLETVTASIQAALTAYFRANAYNKTKVFYMDVGSTILNTVGVASLSVLTINDDTDNIALGDEEIGILGTLIATEATS